MARQTIEELQQFWGEDLNNFEEIERILLQSFSCPVCFKNAYPPISQCLAGHLVCRRCVRSLEICPLCRLRITSLRANVMEELFEICTFPCSYGYNGCTFKGRGILADRHEATCEFSSVQCPFEICGRWLHYIGFLSHLTVEHHVGYRETSSEGNQELVFTVNEVLDVNLPRCDKLCLIKHNDEYFMMLMRKKGDIVSWLFYRFHQYMLQSDYKAIIIIMGREFPYEFLGVFEKFDIKRTRSGPFDLRRLLNLEFNDFHTFKLRIIKNNEITN